MQQCESNSSSKDNCAVCGDQATRLRYSHYGATSCFSCRAFFRRAIEKESFVNYVCRSTSKKLATDLETLDCEVNVMSRKKCAACRFRKCRKVGMRHGKSNSSDRENSFPDLDLDSESADAPGTTTDSRSPTQSPNLSSIDFDPEFHALVSDEEKEKNHFKKLLAIPTSDSSLSPMCFTSEESLKIEQLLTIDREAMIAFGDTLRERNRSIIKKFLTAVFNGKALEFSATCWGYVCGILKLTRFAQNIPEFCDLTIENENKKCLLLHNLDPMFNVRSAFFFQSDAPTFVCQLDRFGIFDLTILKSFCDTLSMGAFSSSIAPMQWKQYFVTPWANSIEHELQYEYLLSCLHSLNLDHQTACLLSVVALFSTEGLQQHQLTIPLENVRSQQYNFSLLLFRYLSHSRGHSEAMRLFPGFIATLESLREMSEILKNKTIKIWPTPTAEQYLDLFMDAP